MILTRLYLSIVVDHTIFYQKHLPVIGVMQMGLFQFPRRELYILHIFNPVEKAVCPRRSSIVDILHNFIINLDFVGRQRSQTHVFILIIKQLMLLGVKCNLFFLPHFFQIRRVKQIIAFRLAILCEVKKTANIKVSGPE